MAEHILRGGQAMVVELPPGMRIRIVDTVGGQLGAMMAFAEADPNRGFSIAASLALSALNRSLGSDTSVALIEDDVVAHQGGEKLLRVAGDTLPVKGIRNIYTCPCNAESYRNEWDICCLGALLHAIAP